MKTLPFFFLIFLSGAFFESCTKADDKVDPSPNIIWLVAEDISPALGCYGDQYARTPNIDRLAAAGVVYDFALTTAPICAPSRSCLISGLYASSLGTQHLRCEIPFPEQLKTLPELMQAQGYFTSNRDKTDYNFDPDGLWEYWSSTLTPWKHREDNRPFFSFINIGPSHEGSVNNLEKYRDFVRDLPTEDLHDPTKVKFPPYYPDSPKTRETWAHYYDILQVLDQNVGLVLDSLSLDGLMDETIIFFMADHGFGMPRYKRWLNKTGMHVPLIVYMPPNYQHLMDGFEAGGHKTEMVSFIDMVPTTLNLAGAKLPDWLEGEPILGSNASPQRNFSFGARDRADDMYEMSRSVTDGRYLYVRHYMPHLPYIQSGVIFSDKKQSFRELRKLYQAGKTNVEQAKLWNPKPIEELYDLQNDPQELNNLAEQLEMKSIKGKLVRELHQWMIKTKDLGLLPEAEYMLRSQGSTPFEYARSSGNYQIESILAAAEMVGTSGEGALLKNLNAEDSGLRYWGVIGLMQLNEISPEGRARLDGLLNDTSPSVQIAAAEALCRFGNSDKAVAVLGELVQSDQPWLALQAARSIQLIGEDARPLIPIMREVLQSLLGEPGKRLKYKDFNFAAFTSWALEWALQEMGEENP
ncbi:MAG: sulfatase-like hydrolase/transferase [Bacteroidota bacterium]